MKDDVYILDCFEIEDFEVQLLIFIEHYKIELKEQKTNVLSFKELVELILSSINSEESSDCTFQHIFYKLRNSIKKHTKFTKEITPETKLVDIFPRKRRRTELLKIERDLGFKLNILQPKKWIIKTLYVLFCISILLLFIHYLFGFLSLLSVVLSFILVNKYGKDFKGTTIRDLINKSSIENYNSFKKNKETINKNEFKQVIYNWFEEYTGYSKDKLEKIQFS